MKIAIDGFNLGLREGTGLSAYGREICLLLAAEGHHVHGLYGVDGVSRNPNVAWPTFIQALANGRADAGSRELGLRRILRRLRYLPPYLAGTAVRAAEVPISPLVDAAFSSDQLPPFDAIHNLPSLFPVAEKLSRLSRRPVKVSLGEPVDVFHLTFPLPIAVSGAVNVVTVPDIIPLALPFSTQVNLKHYWRQIDASIRSADHIFTLSEHSKRDLISYFGISEKRIDVTYLSVTTPEKIQTLGSEAVDDFLKRNYGLSRGEYFLFYGAIQPRKNVMRIVEAMCRAKTKFPLVIVGKDGWLFRDTKNRIDDLIARRSTRKRFHRFPHVPYLHLMTLLKGARGLVFPSLYEGFGIPVLEAMQLGCPVITSTTTSLPEVAGDAGLLVNPVNVDEIAHALDRLAEDDDLCRTLAERGTKQALRFSPARHYDRLLAGYERAVHRFLARNMNSKPNFGPASLPSSRKVPTSSG